MRLLHAEKLIVIQVTGTTPEYAILSRTWEHEEVTLRDLEMCRKHQRPRGFAKIKNACRIAHGAGLDWIWIDTCCIGKTSSAELSEPIKSMFLWYRQAKGCYAYISDVTERAFDAAKLALEPFFPPCKWLTRGWTLQEMIAPRSLDFFSANWTIVGSKDLFARELSRVTGIPPESPQGLAASPSWRYARRCDGLRAARRRGR
jgi:hypothetical protein